MKPEAMRVPFSCRAAFTAASWERVLTNQEMAPPTSRGRLRSMGMNMPSAKGRAGTLQKFSTRAMAAPMPYSSQGAPPPENMGWITAAMALACGATRALSPTKPYVLLSTSITPHTVTALTATPRNFQPSCTLGVEPIQ